MLVLDAVPGIDLGADQRRQNQQTKNCETILHVFSFRFELQKPDVPEIAEFARRELLEQEATRTRRTEGSGNRVMLELASLLGKRLEPDRTIMFVAFSGEESGLLCSRYYVKNMKKYPVEKVLGALNLDTVGRLGENKLLVLNGSSAREWKFIFMGSSYVTGVESEVVTQDLDASDQVSFIEAGIPAVQFFSGAHYDYHRPGDTADKIDAAGLVKVATFVREGVVYLAEREEPMAFTGQKKEESAPPMLIPYGCTKFRMSMFPVTERTWKALGGPKPAPATGK